MDASLSTLRITAEPALAVVTLTHGKVNAIDHLLLGELVQVSRELATAPEIASVVLTGSGKFFSFGFDVPALYDLPRDEFTRFLTTYCDLCRTLFLFPKPLVAAVNGHAVAGGCIFALTADYRVMSAQAGKMALNEVTFGAGLFPAAVEMLRYAVGSRKTQEMILTGRMLTAAESLECGLVDELAEEQHLIQRASEKARDMARYGGPAFANLKNLARGPVVGSWLGREEKAIAEFVDIWYSPRTRELLKGVQIRS